MRKYVCVTYHMNKENEIAETCITIPMDATVADDVLANQECSQYVKEGSSGIAPVKQILSSLAELQGYAEAHFCCAEEGSNF